MATDSNDHAVQHMPPSSNGPAAAGTDPSAAGSIHLEQPPQSQCSTSANQPACWLITYNVSKRHNIGTLLRSATAFGVREVCLVGSRQFNSFGSHGSDQHVALRHFPSLEACCQHLRDVEGCSIVGVEIDPSARPVQSHPFTGNTAFMLGNEGQGLSEKQMQLCDSFVYIPQYGPGTASLNVAVAASIILHQFAIWAGFEERQREGAKYVVDERSRRTNPRGVVPLTPAEVAALKESRAAAQDDGQWLQAALFEHGSEDAMVEALHIE